MAQVKAHQVDGWLKKPDPSVAAVLIYGPDRGMVSERARAYARSVAPDLDDPFNVLKLDAAEIETDPGRLHDEVATVPMFGGGRLIWIAGAGNGRKLAEALAGACEKAGSGVKILIEGGDLKKGTGLRAAVEGLAGAMALPCYSDEGRDLDRLIDSMFEAAGMGITLDARTALKAAIGGDRLASRGEIEKLLLYAAGQQSVTLNDVLASAGDSANVSSDDAVDALLLGKPADFDIAFQRHCRSGAKPFLLASAALRQFQGLQVMRDTMEREGKNAAAIVAAQKPPVFYTRKALMERAVSTWTGPMIARSLERLQGAVLQSRREAELDESIVRQAMLAIALDGATTMRR